MDFAVPANNQVKVKKSEKMNNLHRPCLDTKKIFKICVMPILIAVSVLEIESGIEGL